MTAATVLAALVALLLLPLAVTALRERKVADRVNLEADLLGKYVEQFVAVRRKRA